MVTPLETARPLDASIRQCSPIELVTLIRKLRWMGLDEQAKELQTILIREAPNTACVLSDQGDTD
jgi:hypothetical protein